jgi:hypothetical protein
MFKRIIEILSVPIIFMSAAGSIIGGIWLAILGEWLLIGIGIFLVFTSHYILSILMMPSIPIGMIAMRFYEKKNRFGYFLGYVSQLYSNILMAGTCVLALYICSKFYTGEVGIGYIPYLLWSWEMALGPWQFLASKEPDNEFSAITLFSISVFYFLFLSSIFISQYLVMVIVILFAISQFIILPVFNIYTANKMMTDY